MVLVVKFKVIECMNTYHPELPYCPWGSENDSIEWRKTVPTDLDEIIWVFEGDTRRDTDTAQIQEKFSWQGASGTTIDNIAKSLLFSAQQTIDMVGNVFGEVNIDRVYLCL
jgi:hypothetical protein